MQDPPGHLQLANNLKTPRGAIVQELEAIQTMPRITNERNLITNTNITNQLEFISSSNALGDQYVHGLKGYYAKADAYAWSLEDSSDDCISKCESKSKCNSVTWCMKRVITTVRIASS
jgi:hypothetical protein